MRRVCRSRMGRLGATWGVVLALALAPGALLPGPLEAQPSYPLYYNFKIPLVLPGFSVTDPNSIKTPPIGGVLPPPGSPNDQNVQTFYAGTIAGTLGGVTVKTGKFRYGLGASKSAGGGTFSLTTDAGSTSGQILLTVDGERTTLLFFGVYLGARIEFSLVTKGMLIGGEGYTANGLAPTGFASHDAYMAAVQKAVASTQEATRQQIISAADTNQRLVRDYQQHSH
ncbi:MAG TPA: hypothetical protein VEZ44_11680 [bacterium]|nr:hypothetical protein [bacterium]